MELVLIKQETTTLQQQGQLKKCCSVSLFRPFVRKNNYALYHDALLVFATEFQTTFPGWFLRVYYDKSLFTLAYRLDPVAATVANEPTPGVAGSEAPYWTALVERLAQMPHVELVNVVAWPLALLPDRIHHRELSGMFFRFHALMDNTLDVCIVRDIDGRCLSNDYLSMEHWIRTTDPSTTILHYYDTDYKPNSVTFAKRIREKRSTPNVVTASMFAVRPKLVATVVSWEGTVERACTKYSPQHEAFTYAFDEFVLNTVIFRRMLRGGAAFTRTAQPTFDFYVPATVGSYDDDNLHGLFYLMPQLATVFQTYCQLVERGSQYDFLRDTPVEHDANREDVSIHAGYVCEMLYMFLQHPTSDAMFKTYPNSALFRYHTALGYPKNTIMIWDHMFANNVPIRQFGDFRVYAMLGRTRVPVRLISLIGSGVVRGRTLYDVIQEQLSVLQRGYPISVDPHRFVPPTAHMEDLWINSYVRAAGAPVAALYLLRAPAPCTGCNSAIAAFQCECGSASYCGEACADTHWTSGHYKTH